MDLALLRKLKEWRIEAAQKEGVELFRVFPNKVLDDIASLRPGTKDDLLAIKGIKDRKFEKYGKDILALIHGEGEAEAGGGQEAEAGGGQKLYTVSGFLDLLNSGLRSFGGRVRGEVSSLDARGNYLFFSLKDKKDQSALSCFMWGRDYQLCGIEIEEGMEVVVAGYPAVHKPTGKLSIQASTVELVGEGALKKAYEALKKKLEAEGLFAKERKKDIPDLVRTIGLITSETGAVIHDFLNNLGKWGYRIKFAHSRVEGQVAVSDLMSAIDLLDGRDTDVLVIIRGGGSLESLQAFNNEALVRKIAGCETPVICGIGHDKDAPLASLVADFAPSTPTAAANYLNKSWDSAAYDLSGLERELLYKYGEALKIGERGLEDLNGRLRKHAGAIFREFDKLKHRLKNILTDLGHAVRNAAKTLDDSLTLIFKNFRQKLEAENDFLGNTEQKLKIFNPARQLKLGYSIAMSAGRVIKSVKQVEVGNQIDIHISDGRINSTVNKIN